MAAKRYLIVNADDFGQSHSVNWGIIEAHERGIVTSTSLMVRWPAAAEAAAYSRQHPNLSLGLHVDFGEWAYRGEHWVSLYQVVPFNDTTAVADEVSRQLTTFRRLVAISTYTLGSHCVLCSPQWLVSLPCRCDIAARKSAIAATSMARQLMELPVLTPSAWMG